MRFSAPVLVPLYWGGLGGAMTSSHRRETVAKPLTKDEFLVAVRLLGCVRASFLVDYSAEDAVLRAGRHPVAA